MPVIAFFIIRTGKPACRGSIDMTEKELKKLSRRDLLELLLKSREENERLKEQISIIKGQLGDVETIQKSTALMSEVSNRLERLLKAVDSATTRYEAQREEAAATSSEDTADGSTGDKENE